MSLLLGYNIDKASLASIDLNKVKVISTINPHSYCISKKDKAFETALKNADVLLPDGIGIVLAAKILNKEHIQKIAGYDLFMHLMAHLNTTKGSCFFLGASNETLEKITEKVTVEYPNVSVHTYSPPYKTQFSEADSKLMYEQVNTVKPDVLFVGMTAPKQEKWVDSFKDHLDANIICSIGAVFDFYAGDVKRSSPFWISLGLEWLPRFLKEPKRLAERNLISTPKFLLEILSHKLFNRGIL